MIQYSRKANYCTSDKGKMIGGWADRLDWVAQMARQNMSHLIYHNTVAAPAGINSSKCFFMSRRSDLCRCKTASKTNRNVSSRVLPHPRLSGGRAEKSRVWWKKVGFRTAAVWQMLSVEQHERYWLARLDVTTSKHSARWGGWCNSISKKYLENTWNIMAAMTQRRRNLHRRWVTPKSYWYPKAMFCIDEIYATHHNLVMLGCSDKGLCSIFDLMPSL